MAIVGTAAWSIGRDVADRFPADGASLSRYAAVLNGVEINSSFYRIHKPDTWRRWADSVPGGFRFAVKLPRRISHELKLVDAAEVFDAFLADVALLGDRLGPLLLQLPPSLVFDPETVAVFLTHVRRSYPGRLVIEPRHRSWVAAPSSALLAQHDVTRVHADPAPIANDAPDPGFQYLRLHGTPKIYYSAYGQAAQQRFAAILNASSKDSWCIFDNTASGAALKNALELMAMF
jgi:uncharacterized protein YecE (DUF72 family)